jgi:hypothetical protein
VEARLTRRMRAYKFLQPGRVGPFSNFTWPLGEWVEAGDVSLCAHGIHACRVRDLPYWLAAELWEAELDGDVREEERKVVAARGQLVRRIDGWNGAAGARFADACAARTRDRAEAAGSEELTGFAADAAANASAGEVAVLGYIAARAAEIADGEAGYAAERAAQAAWLAAELGLAED